MSEFDVAIRGGKVPIMVHSEVDTAAGFMTKRLVAAGKKSPHYHAVSRPKSAKHKATHRSISCAELTDAPILRGRVVAQDGRIVGENSKGRFLKRRLSPYAVPG